jgi:hypothetical protein
MRETHEQKKDSLTQATHLFSRGSRIVRCPGGLSGGSCASS